MSENQPYTPASETLSVFATRAKANEGIEVPLPLPDGTPSGVVLRVLHRDSDAYRKAMADYRRNLVRMGAALADDTETDLRLVAACVAGWNLPNAFSTEDVVDLFRASPYIFDLVEAKVYSGKDFFGSKA
jgi:hypothetical protein